MQNRKYYLESKNIINAKRRKCYIDNINEMQFKESWNDLFSKKGNFNTLASKIPCHTTEYGLAPTPETSVVNWYQYVKKWCLERLMEDIQD
jgi:hypothetical protein